MAERSSRFPTFRERKIKEILRRRLKLYLPLVKYTAGVLHGLIPEEIFRKKSFYILSSRGKRRSVHGESELQNIIHILYINLNILDNLLSVSVGNLVGFFF